MDWCRLSDIGSIGFRGMVIYSPYQCLGGESCVSHSTVKALTPFTSRSKITCARVSFRAAWLPRPACQPVASWRATWALTASPWRTHIPSWKQTDWYSPGWAAARTFCRPIRYHRFPKPRPELRGRSGNKACRAGTRSPNLPQPRKCSKPPGIRTQWDQRFTPIPG